MVLGAEIMALLKSMIVLPLTSSELGFHLLGLAGGNRAKEMPPQETIKESNT